MIFNAAPLLGVYTVDLEKREDERGFFARVFCRREFEAHGLETQFVQMNSSLSTKRGVLRGLHFQRPPAAEVKLVRCIKGALFDFVVDLRPDSPTFRQWFGKELSESNRTMMYVPRGFGHAFVTLSDETEVMYLVSDFYSPAHEGGLRYDDPDLSVSLPVAVTERSHKDQTWPLLSEQDLSVFSGI